MIIDIWMVVENVKTLGIAEKFEIYIYIYTYIYIIHIYIYIIFLTYLYSYSITTLYRNVVSKNLIIFCMFDCFVTSPKVLPWQLGIIPQIATTYEANTSRQPSESVYELDLD